jgi:UDP-3-O-[3-hydroxymyristoyl] glucosamine N-acyltransferase
MTEEYVQTFRKDNITNFEVTTSDAFFQCKNKNNYQYIISLWYDMKERARVSAEVEKHNLDCVTYINDSVYYFDSSKIGKGCFIAHQTIISWNAEINDHCYIGLSSKIGHDSKLGKNCIVSPYVGVSGRCTIGNNCFIGGRSTVLAKVSVIDNVHVAGVTNVTKDIVKPGRYAGYTARYIGEV